MVDREDIEPLPQELAYAAQLQALQPSGLAWTPDRTSNLWALLRGLGASLARADARGRDLEAEIDPNSTTELLPEWETFLGLPDECTGELEDLAARRGAVLAHFVGQGGQTPQALIDLAAAYGFTITIVEYPTALFGWFTMGQPLTTWGNPAFFGTWTMNQPMGLLVGWPWTFDVVTDAFTITHWGMGSSFGQPLATWGNDILECVILRAAPAHCLVRFIYTLTLSPSPAVARLQALDPTLA